MTMRQGSEDYTPDHSAQNERYQLQQAIKRSLLNITPQPPQDVMVPVVSDEGVIIGLTGE